ncbi:PD-(D/E)XK nuclease family transposase [Eubacterium ramulus]|uniref:PD-(D/E)XK nuclease family transposase n=1 Tax=Eubacterium ramulus TaxID=39490 RepID=UPI00300F23AA
MQSSERNLYGRSVRLDALCVLGNGKKCNVEVQRSDNDDHLRRVRFNAASIAVKDSQEGEKFEQIEDIIVVYISQFDIFKADRVLYHVDSTIRETGNRVDDGLYRVFVNTEVKDGTTVSEYMECFLKKEVNNSKFPAFTKRMNALKHEERGLNAVCEVMEKYEQKAVEEGLSLFEKAITMLASGKSPSEVVLTGVPQNIVDRASRAMKPKLNK